MRTYKLKDLLTIRNGKDHKEINSGDYPIFGSGGIMRFGNKYLYDKPSILLPRKGSLSNIQYCEQPFWTVDTLYYTEVDNQKVNPYYLYSYLRLLDLSNLDSGTGVPSMTFSSYYNIKVKLPDIHIQNRLAKILKNIDDKIAINREINRNLEVIAKQLYDYWFVQFDFPDENGKPYKSSGGEMVYNEKLKREIPKGWTVVNLSEYLNTYIDKISPDKVDKKCKYAPIEVLPRNKMSFDESVPIDNALSGLCRFKKRQILLSNRRVYFHKVCIAAFNGITRDTVIILEPINKDLLGYTYQLINDDIFIDYATRHSYGSEQPVLSWESAKKHKVFKPLKNLELLYSNRINQLIDIVLKNELEISLLKKQRDELLPLLMNGQVSVMPTEVNCDLSHD